ncbi:MAG: hypothetical protein OEX18_10985 [Candidatus Krumholzibacteria bacterium]|nr:hypothetical protein [Candidatus Krumholzibacteria bacterium]MDH4337784.1 hypothetical protein [Candidatus Krumholzibacteria bacterium]MDH5270838.1 hypothetical protein [Candidatus Krumholzibacteria bacterium]
MPSQSLVILKIGGSVLTDEGAMPIAVREVSRYLASYDRVVAVVSAFKNQTDALQNKALDRCPQPDPDTFAFYLGLGEMQTTTELALALQGAGVEATARMPWDVSFVCSGSPLDATPAAVNARAFRDAFRENRVVVFPGFIGCGADGRPNVLGRGGSDLTAIFLAAELGAARCIMLKDVPGVFEWDPARQGPRPRHFSKISWNDAAHLGGKWLRPGDVEYAHQRSVIIEIMAPETPGSTAVGPDASQLDPPGELGELKRGSGG